MEWQDWETIRKIYETGSVHLGLNQKIVEEINPNCREILSELLQTKTYCDKLNADSDKCDKFTTDNE